MRRDIFISKSTLEIIIDKCTTKNDVNFSVLLISHSNKLSTFKTTYDLLSLISQPLEENLNERLATENSEQESPFGHFDIFEASKICCDPNKYLGLVGGRSWNIHYRLKRCMVWIIVDHVLFTFILLPTKDVNVQTQHNYGDRIMQTLFNDEMDRLFPFGSKSIAFVLQILCESIFYRKQQGACKDYQKSCVMS